MQTQTRRLPRLMVHQQAGQARQTVAEENNFNMNMITYGLVHYNPEAKKLIDDGVHQFCL